MTLGRPLGFLFLVCAGCLSVEEVNPAMIDSGKPSGRGGAPQGGAGGTDPSGGGSSTGGATTGGGGTTGSGGSAATGGVGGATGGVGGATGGVGGTTGSGGSATGGGGTGGGPAKDGGTDSSAGRGGAATGGSGGTSGTGGSGGGPSDASTAGLHVLYAVLKTQPSSAYVQCELHAKNNGTSSAQVSALKLRYYFTDEVKKTPQVMINWSHICIPGNCGNDMTVTSTVVPNVPPATGADTYLEFGFSSGHASLGPGESADFTFQMQGPNPAMDLYTQTNDHSFDSSKTSLSPWPNVVLLQNGNVAWGTPP